MDNWRVLRKRIHVQNKNRRTLLSKIIRKCEMG
jgi:hypothetical protein